MDPSGVIYGLIAVVWLAYIVPMMLSRRDAHGSDAEPADPFSDSVRLVHRGIPEEDIVDDDLEFSTPATRRSQLWTLRLIARQSATKRRRLTLLLALTMLALGVTSYLHRTPWLAVAVACGLVVAFLVYSAISSALLGRALLRRANQIRYGDDEPTIAIYLAGAERSVELTGPIAFTGSLWDPVPVTSPTYVQKPLAPRTVRTIDLSAPSAMVPAVPPTAERPAIVETASAIGTEDTGELDMPRAVGE